MIGQFAVSKAGHDKGNLYVVAACEGEFVFLCDGKTKTQERPKKKKWKHIQPIKETVEEELLQRFQAGGKVYPEEIRYAIKKYMETQ
ncbi:MAG: KOW domain-containing RNA-binding protein [Blautia sp.]|nr:KOW domain-containing RNA-binding protein [Blautia sp.]